MPRHESHNAEAWTYPIAEIAEPRSQCADTHSVMKARVNILVTAGRPAIVRYKAAGIGVKGTKGFVDGRKRREGEKG